jgi:hypothetical protein
MGTVHVFISTGQFRSFKQMRVFIDPTYTEDGDEIPSPFMREVGLSVYEPMCIEAIHSEQIVTLPNLLEGASYSDQLLRQLDGTRWADAAICVFSPNEVETPKGSSLEYSGAFQYRP